MYVRVELHQRVFSPKTASTPCARPPARPSPVSKKRCSSDRTLECFIMREGLSVFSSPPGEQATNPCAGHTPHDVCNGQQQQQRSASLFSEKMAGSVPHKGTAGSVLQKGMPVSVPLETVVSAVLQEEMAGSNPQEGMVARPFSAQGMAGSFPVAAYTSGGDELETSADTLETSAETCSTDYSSPAQANRSDRSATSSVPSSHRWEAEKMPDADVTPTRKKHAMLGKGGLDGLGGDPDMSPVSRGLSSDMEGLPYDTVEGGVAAPDWLDITHAMLSAIDDPSLVSG